MLHIATNNIYNITYIHVDVCIGAVYVASLTNWVILGVELVKTVKGVAILWEEPVEDVSDGYNYDVMCSHISDHINLGQIRPSQTLS